MGSKRRWSARAKWLTAAGTVVAAVAAIGFGTALSADDSNDSRASTGTHTTTEPGDHKTASSGRAEARSGSGPDGDASSDGSGTGIQGESPENDAFPDGKSERAAASTCPPSLTPSQCKAAGRAYEQGGSDAVEKRECPPALSPSQCRAAGKAYREGKR